MITSGRSIDKFLWREDSLPKKAAGWEDKITAKKTGTSQSAANESKNLFLAARIPGGVGLELVGDATRMATAIRSRTFARSN